MRALDHATLSPKASPDFVETPHVQGIIDRAQLYLKSGFPVHLRGPSGTGKTTVALRLAQRLGRPVILLHGDEDMRTADLVGGESGRKIRQVRDNFIHSVLKIEEDVRSVWSDARLTLAVEQGFTLVYDEYTRSRPETNNVLLSVLQEGILSLPRPRADNRFYLRAHPQFCAIFTSNPEEYAGVHRSQDALRDRMVTLDLPSFDLETEVRIAASKGKLPEADAARVVQVVRALRDSGKCEFAPTVRASIMIAKVLSTAGLAGQTWADNAAFRAICLDLLSSESSRSGGAAATSRVQRIIESALDALGRGTTEAASTNPSGEAPVVVAPPAILPPLALATATEAPALPTEGADDEQDVFPVRARAIGLSQV